MTTAPGIAIVNPNPKIAAINFDFDFIETPPLLGPTLPERMQAECQCGATGNVSINRIVFSKLGVGLVARKRGDSRGAGVPVPPVWWFSASGPDQSQDDIR